MELIEVGRLARHVKIKRGRSPRIARINKLRATIAKSDFIKSYEIL